MGRNIADFTPVITRVYCILIHFNTNTSKSHQMTRLFRFFVNHKYEMYYVVHRNLYI